MSRGIAGNERTDAVRDVIPHFEARKDIAAKRWRAEPIACSVLHVRAQPSAPGQIDAPRGREALLKAMESPTTADRGARGPGPHPPRGNAPTRAHTTEYVVCPRADHQRHSGREPFGVCASWRPRAAARLCAESEKKERGLKSPFCCFARGWSGAYAWEPLLMTVSTSSECVGAKSLPRCEPVLTCHSTADRSWKGDGVMMVPSAGWRRSLSMRPAAPEKAASEWSCGLAASEPSRSRPKTTSSTRDLFLAWPSTLVLRPLVPRRSRSPTSDALPTAPSKGRSTWVKSDMSERSECASAEMAVVPPSDGSARDAGRSRVGEAAKCAL
mmetsp:Transcript_20355/g.54808  ORF Transcript_20355/g.54808 Transcript_20355/m.54808 type:complete len:327 (-) Transcript_20355:999-1979(-)